MSVNDWVITAAVLLGPIFAIQVQKCLDSYKEKKGRKLEMFKTLMATRATQLDVSRVQALNRIELEFPASKKKNKNVLDAWKAYLDHLVSHDALVPSGDPDYKIKEEGWETKAQDYFADLLQEMGKPLGYEFDKVHIKKNTYRPKGHHWIEMELNLIRWNLLDILLGKKSFPIKVTEVIQEGQEPVHQIESPK